MPSALDLRLYVILDPALMPAGGEDLLAIAEAALRGGAGTLQLRDKRAQGAELVALSVRLVALCARYGASLIVNDRLDVALVAGAAGVHLGPEDLSVEDAKRIAPGLLVGASAGTPRRAAELVAQGADYLGVGALFDAHQSKPDASAPRGLEALRQVRQAIGPEVPCVGIGGVTASSAASVIQAGGDGVAVIRAVCAASDPEHASRELLDAMKR